MDIPAVSLLPAAQAAPCTVAPWQSATGRHHRRDTTAPDKCCEEITRVQKIEMTEEELRGHEKKDKNYQLLTTH